LGSSSGDGEGGGGDASDPSLAIKQAVQLLQEAGGLLKIEDILPFFPDFVVIDNFQVGEAGAREHQGNIQAALELA
jgi:hypothetical protein